MKRCIFANLVKFGQRHELMWERQWKKYLTRLDHSKYPDASWNWPLIFELCSHHDMRAFALEYEGDLQGLLVATIYRAKNRLGEPALFVEYVATAPWNRTDNILIKYGRSRFWGVGSSLIYCAVSLSEKLGYRGRIALESEFEAAGFYEYAIGMKKIEVMDDCIYFEFDEVAAFNFKIRFKNEVRDRILNRSAT